jgi:RNA polymerase sigma factor (sigma-70 family)
VSLPPFQSLLDAYGHDVHRFLTASLGPVDADDCYQETWLAALRAYPRLRNAANLRSWILTVAHRKAIDHHRARARHPVPIEEVAAVTATRASQVAAPSLPEDGSGVWGQVAALPTKQRTALALRFVADLPSGEIATVMQTSDEAARRNVHEALKRLRRENDEP